MGWSGSYHKGAMRTLREIKTSEAAERTTLTSDDRRSKKPRLYFGPALEGKNR